MDISLLAGPLTRLWVSLVPSFKAMMDLSSPLYCPQMKLRGGNVYRPQRSCGQGNIFTPVCHSVHRGVVVSHKALRQNPPPRTRHTTHPLDLTPPGQGTPPEADSGIWSTSGRYASYWNAFLFSVVLSTWGPL